MRDPESVAEHTMRVAQLAALIAVEEYEAKESGEARCASDADKLEMLFQAVEYRDTGVQRVDGWIDSARTSLKTETARRIAEAALTLSPLAWRDR